VSLDDFLDNKPLYYKEIDHERVHKAYAKLYPLVRHPKTIHIVGTNGKGSTGRIIAHLAMCSGMHVGHYSSPHILRHNERIWLDGDSASDMILEEAHQRLYSVLGGQMSEELSYFEYMTLLALVVFEDCDLMVLEAGLGGEYDATNVVDKVLSVITPIGIDHQAFLGEDIEDIAKTKIKSIQTRALLAPQIYDVVVRIANEIANEKNAKLSILNDNQLLDDHFTNIEQVENWPRYLQSNALVAMKALDILNIEYDIEELSSLELFGRFYRLSPNVHIDVGHNPLAAEAIYPALSKETILIYNSLDDKDYEQVLKILAPKIKWVEIISIETSRAIAIDKLESALQKINLEYRSFNGVIDKSQNYLVFGSFYVVEAFMKSLK